MERHSHRLKKVVYYKEKSKARDVPRGLADAEQKRLSIGGNYERKREPKTKEWLYGAAAIWRVAH